MDTKFTFKTPLNDSTGAPLSAAAIAALTYNVLVDTVNPPLKAFPVPAANVSAATSNSDGTKTVTVLFTDIGFTPASNVTYFATAVDSEGGLASGDANIVSFTNTVAAANPTAFTVS